MIQFCADYMDNLAGLHTEMMKAVRHLPQEALDWIPYPGGNSLSVLVVHTAGAEKFWLGDVIANEPTGRDRPAEFKVEGLGVKQLEAKLDESLGFGELVLAKLNLEDLGQMRINPRSDQEVTVYWAMNHTLKHTAQHLGHIEVTRDLWLEKTK